MEIEAKFAIPDKKTFDRLAATNTLGGYPVSEGQTQELDNQYLDTMDRKLIKAGLFLRKRQKGKEFIITLKGEGTVVGGVHRREELEESHTEDQPFEQWPDSELKRKVRNVIRTAKLELLFDSKTVRTVRMLSVSGKEVAEIAIDHVSMTAGDTEDEFMELEAELLSDTDEWLLSELSKVLVREYGLKPEQRSKFQRGLEFADNARRSVSRPIPKAKPRTVKQFFEPFRVETGHAGRVTANALRLFDLLRPQHGLSNKERTLLTLASQLHDVGYSVNADGHHVIGRDILLQNPVKGLKAKQQRMLAWVVFLHGDWHDKKALEAAKKAGLGKLPEAQQEEVLKVGAILRMADGLDFSRAGSAITGLIPGKKRFVFEVTGEDASTDARRAGKKSDLWHLVLSPDLEFKAMEKPAKVMKHGRGRPRVRPATGPGISKEDDMSQAAHKVLRHQFEAMLRNESGTLEGRDHERLHDMRVAAMRMRAAFEVFEDFIPGKKLDDHLSDIKLTRRVLGPVRDLDVLIEDAKAYPKATTGKPMSMKPVIDAINEQREGLRCQMAAYLQSQGYSRFKAKFQGALLEDGIWNYDAGNLKVTSSSGGVAASKVKDLAPVLIYKQLAAVRAYDRVLASGKQAPLETLHQLRIAFKLLRYTLEFFKEVLGSEQAEVVTHLKSVQDHLGLLHDGMIAIPVLELALQRASAGGKGGRRVQALQRYMAYRKRVLRRLVVTFSKKWAGFLSPEFGDKVALALRPAMG